RRLDRREAAAGRRADGGGSRLRGPAGASPGLAAAAAPRASLAGLPPARSGSPAPRPRAQPPRPGASPGWGLRPLLPPSRLPAGADDDALEGASHLALSAAGTRVESDAVGAEDLAAPQRPILRRHDLAAEPPFHHAALVAPLARPEGGLPVGPDVRHPRHPAGHLDP